MLLLLILFIMFVFIFASCKVASEADNISEKEQDNGKTV